LSSWLRRQLSLGVPGIAFRQVPLDGTFDVEAALCGLQRHGFNKSRPAIKMRIAGPSVRIVRVVVAYGHHDV